jgi:hypothetical protein
MYASLIGIMWICVVLSKNFNETSDQKVVVLTRNPDVTAVICLDKKYFLLPYN